MMNKRIGIILLSSALLLGVFIYFDAKVETKIKEEEEFNLAPSEVWNFITDMQNIPSRIPAIHKVIFIDSNATSANYKLETKDKGWFIIQVTNTSDSTRIVNFLESSIGYTGVWNYRLSDLGNESCKLYIEETSKLKNPLLQFAFVLMRRKAIVSEEFRGLKYMAKEDL